jgi:hypothetical protein
MDPYVSVKLGNRKQKTRTHQSGGVTPVWEESLTFTLTVDMIQRNDLIEIEIWDEDTIKDDFSSRCEISLKNAIMNRNKETMVVVYNSKGTKEGEIWIEFGFTGKGNSSLGEDKSFLRQKSDVHTGPKIMVYPIQADLLRNEDKSGSIKPYLEARLGQGVQRTSPGSVEGIRPEWTNQVLTFRKFNPVSDVMALVLFDKEGSPENEADHAEIKVSEIIEGNDYTNYFELKKRNGEYSGILQLRFEVAEDSHRGGKVEVAVEARGGQEKVVHKSIVMSEDKFGQQSHVKSVVLEDERTLVYLKIFQAKLKKDLDTFSKMDPYCKIKILGPSAKNPEWKSAIKTSVKNGAGMTPVWDESFNLRNLGSYDTIRVEVWDEDPVSDDFGWSVELPFKIIQSNYPLVGGAQWYALKDDKNRPDGSTIELLIETRPDRGQTPSLLNPTPHPPPQTAPMVPPTPPPKKHTATSGSLSLRPKKPRNNNLRFKDHLNAKNASTGPGWLYINITQADIYKDTDTFGSMDPYFKLRISGEEFLGSTQENAGKKPRWDMAYFLPIDKTWNSEVLTFEVWDKDTFSDDLIGSGQVNIGDRLDKKYSNDWYKVNGEGGGLVGKLQIEFDYCSGLNPPFSVFSEIKGTCSVTVIE